MKRAARDVKELISSGFEVMGENENEEYSVTNFLVVFSGPKDTPYENNSWRLRFTLPNEYPFKSPSVGFVEKILHPNVDEVSGSVCLDSLNKSWSPAFTLKHIVETVMPYLLTYPNPEDPLNRDAAYLMKTNPTAWDKKVRQHSESFSFKKK